MIVQIAMISGGLIAIGIEHIMIPQSVPNDGGILFGIGLGLAVLGCYLDIKGVK